MIINIYYFIINSSKKISKISESFPSIYLIIDYLFIEYNILFYINITIQNIFSF
jgi:hypothetical protein